MVSLRRLGPMRRFTGRREALLSPSGSVIFHTLWTIAKIMLQTITINHLKRWSLLLDSAKNPLLNQSGVWGYGRTPPLKTLAYGKQGIS